MKTTAILGALLAGASLSAQTFTLDSFDVGDLSESGAADYTQTLTEPDVLGEKRSVRLYNDDGSSIAVSGGSFTFTKTDNSVTTLRYGDFVGNDPAEDLHFNFGQGQFFVDVESLTAPFDMHIDLRGNEGFRGQTKTISSAGITTFDYADFTGQLLDVTDISGIELAFTGNPSTFEISGITGELSPVPEPSTYAFVFGVCLAGYAARRRYLATHPVLPVPISLA